MKWKKIALSFLACLFGLLLAGNVLASSSDIETEDTQLPLPAPTIISPDPKTITSDQQPPIAGFTITDSFVKIYIDGTYNGKTRFLQHRSGTAYFSYTPFLKLKRGWHEYKAIAVFPDGRQSQASIGRFNVEYPMSAPTMLKTYKNKQANSKPLAIGLAKNDSRILVYVDNRYNGSFLVKNHPSGTANFAYRVNKNLGRGIHKIYTVAQDARGKKSIRSNPLYYRILEPRISTAAFEKNTAAKKEDGGQGLKVEVKRPAKNPEASGSRPGIDREVQKILEDSKLSGTTSAPGSLDENNSSQNKLKTNIIIFILLLLGIIGWIVWVNREIVKERKDTDKKDDSQAST